MKNRNKKTKEMDVSEKNLINKIKDKILNELNPSQEVKNIVFIKTSHKSINCIPFYNYSSETEFIEPNSKEIYALIDSFMELEGVPIYLVHKDTHVNYIMEFVDVSSLSKDDKDIYILKQKLMSASLIYSIHESTHIKNWMAKPKLDFNMSLTVLLLIGICCMITYMVSFAIYN